MPYGPDRMKACAERRVEAMKGVAQVLHVLDETQLVLEGHGVESEDRCRLCAHRLSWAFDMAVGFQQGATALQWLEETDPGRTCSGECTGEDEYCSVMSDLEVCHKKIDDLARLLMDDRDDDVERQLQRRETSRDLLEAVGEQVVWRTIDLGTGLIRSLAPFTGLLDRVIQPVFDVLWLVVPKFPYAAVQFGNQNDSLTSERPPSMVQVAA